MRRLFTTLFAVVIALGSLVAQTSLKGTILSDETGSPIQGAKITLANQNISTTTNASGEFALIYLEAIDEEVIVEASGFVTDVLLVNLKENEQNSLGDFSLKTDIQKEMQDEVVLQLSEMDLNDDEGKSQSMSSGANAVNDVFNQNTGFAWSSVRYRQRGYEQRAEHTYINGLNFNSSERGTFNYSMLGGLNDASRNKDVVNGIEASGFTYGDFGKSTNIMMDATRYAQGWKVGLSGTNRSYKGRVFATYSSGLLANGWAFVGSVAWRYSPLINMKGIIAEGQDYNSLGYFFSAQKKWGDEHSLSLVTFGAPTERSQSSAITQEIVDLTGTTNYNPYWGYQNGKMRNSRVVKAFDPTILASYDWKIDEDQTFKAAVGYHYSFYSNSALTFYNAPDPRPDYYRNMPSFLLDGQLDGNGNLVKNLWSYGSDKSTKDWDGKFDYWDGISLGNGEVVGGSYVGPSIDANNYSTLTELWQNRDNAATQINWDRIYAANYAYKANNENNPLHSSKYMLERRHNDIQEIVGNLNYRNTQFNHLVMTAGVEAKYSQGIHYKTVDDLLGGDQWYDVDPFAERDIKDLATNIGLSQTDIERVKQNDVAITDETKRVVKQGDRFGYDYQINMMKAAAWFQNEWNFNQVDFYYALQATYSSMQRTTNMLNGRAWYLASLETGNPNNAMFYLGPNGVEILKNANSGQFQKSYAGYKFNFVDPSFKAGVTYKVNARNRIKLNLMAQTEAPLARDAYISPRVHDRVVNTIYTHAAGGSLRNYYAASQKVAGGDLTYEFNFPIVRGRVTAYYTRYWNGTELNGYYDDEARTFVNQSITGIDRVHRGVEAAASIKTGDYITLTPMLAIGDYRYTSNAMAYTSAENGMALAEANVAGKNTQLYELQDSILIKGLHVASGPQLNASLKIGFFHPKMWFADLTISYFDWSWLDFAPSRRMQGLYTGKRAMTYSGLDADGNRILTPSAGTAVNGQYQVENGVYDKYGTPKLQYPYNVMADQETLVNNNVWNRFMIDASVGKLIYLPKRQSISINLSVSNLTNNTKFKTGGYQQARLPRLTKQGQPDSENSVISTNAWKFPSKYYYAWGVNFFLNVTYKF